MVRLEDVSVCYRAPRQYYTTFKEYMIRLLQGKVQHDFFWALREVSLNIVKGEVFGLIGRNGAGKSTLLKLVARVMQPTKGRIVTYGRVAPLLELGAGFHPDLTGRENVYLNAAILGFDQKDVAQRFDRIVDFAELQDFIDAPLRTYSSGMSTRLGFAVATDVRPDILIVDEVLGVGDEAFQRKCFNRIQGFSRAGTTILLVSHDSALIETMCHRAAWLDHGRLMSIGNASEVVRQYHQSQNMN
jgi:ABC-type polysaccharide/polyol phosphate transport system ATPase subunit